MRRSHSVLLVGAAWPTGTSRALWDAALVDEPSMAGATSMSGWVSLRAIAKRPPAHEAA
jgi:hypothetical protein